MDSLTHIVLGAAIGEVLAGRKLGKKALLIGAVANSLPDIDFVASFWLDTAHDVWAHRGLTHSFLFILIMTPLLSWLTARLLPRSGMTRKDWWLFFGLQLFVHDFIDAFNAYGTGWFEPFDHHRFAFHVLFVADPFFSIWLAISFVALLLLRSQHPARKKWAFAGLLLSTTYLCYCIGNKISTDTHAKADLQRQQLNYTRYISTPTPLNNWLWYIVAEDSSGFYTGYRSVFDHEPVRFRFQPRHTALLKPFLLHSDLRYLVRSHRAFIPSNNGAIPPSSTTCVSVRCGGGLTPRPGLCFIIFWNTLPIIRWSYSGDVLPAGTGIHWRCLSGVSKVTNALPFPFPAGSRK